MFRNCKKLLTTYAGAYIESDDNSILADARINLKQIQTIYRKRISLPQMSTAYETKQTMVGQSKRNQKKSKEIKPRQGEVDAWQLLNLSRVRKEAWRVAGFYIKKTVNIPVDSTVETIIGDQQLLKHRVNRWKMWNSKIWRSLCYKISQNQ